MKTPLVVGLAAATLLTPGLANTTMADATEVSASAVRQDLAGSMIAVPMAINDAVIKNSSNSNTTLWVCQNWGTNKCASTSPWLYLKPGENTKTKYRVADADGIFIIAGHRYDFPGVGQVSNVCLKGNTQYKVSGHNGGTFTVWIWKC